MHPTGSASPSFIAFRRAVDCELRFRPPEATLSLYADVPQARQALANVLRNGENHGGTIGIDSRLGKGSTIPINLFDNT